MEKMDGFVKNIKHTLQNGIFSNQTNLVIFYTVHLYQLLDTIEIKMIFFPIETHSDF